MGVSVEEAKKVIDGFFSIVPKVKSFLKGLGDLGKKRGYIRTSQPYGRIRWFEKWQMLQSDPNNENKFKWLGEIERRSMNTPIQGSNGDIIKLALVKVQEEIDKNNWPVRILLSIYDEIQTECREDRAEEWSKKLEEIMIQSARTILKEVPLNAECKVSNHWVK